MKSILEECIEIGDLIIEAYHNAVEISKLPDNLLPRNFLKKTYNPGQDCEYSRLYYKNIEIFECSSELVSVREYNLFYARPFNSLYINDMPALIVRSKGMKLHEYSLPKFSTISEESMFQDSLLKTEDEQKITVLVSYIKYKLPNIMFTAKLDYLMYLFFYNNKSSKESRCKSTQVQNFFKPMFQNV